ncbi:adhesion G protein-coupled receptor E5 isoform X2 [Pseudophryne corroboree]
MSTTRFRITCQSPTNRTQCSDNICPPKPESCLNTSNCSCMEGFQKNYVGNTFTCEDRTQCSDNICPPEPESCLNTSKCSCTEGFKKNYGGNTFTCEDIQECRDGSNKCGAFTKCRNLRGGYFCECFSGTRRGNETQFCPTGNKAENVCTDIDECTESPGICGPNSNCTNTPPHYNCTCHTGYWNISNRCEVKCQYPNISKPCDDKSFLCAMEKFKNDFTPQCGEQKSPSGMKLLDDLDDLISAFNYSTIEERLQNVGLLLQYVEDTVQNLAIIPQINLPQSNKNVDINIRTLRSTSKNESLLLQGIKSTVTVKSSENADVRLAGCVEYSNIAHLLEGAKLLGNYSEKHTFQLVSPVISAFLGTNIPTDHPILLHLNYISQIKKNFNGMHCVFWSVSESAWSSEGCTKLAANENGVICNCTHLTSFAVLMALHDFESWTLTLITKFGLSLSVLCLALSIITFCFCRSLRGTRNTIHTHLCISLFFGNCIFLLGITAVQSKVLCGIVAGLLHACYLSAFCWMALEGLELYLMLVKVFNTHLKTRYLLAVGYGTPVVIVIISAAVNHQGYGTETYCWLSLERGFIWSFMGPVSVIILVTCGIFVLTVWKLAEKMASINPEQGKLKRIRTLTVTSVAQLCILGCSWIFGFFMFSPSALVLVYIFTILNTLQGVQIFLLHCLLHKKVRADYMQWFCAVAHFKSPVYSEFSNTNTQSKGKTTSKESGL